MSQARMHGFLQRFRSEPAAAEAPAEVDFADLGTCWGLDCSLLPPDAAEALPPGDRSAPAALFGCYR